MTSGVARRPLDRGDIHLWWIALGEVSPIVLPAADQGWIDASIDPILAGRRRSSRTALRQLLGAYLGRPAAELEFERDAHGKPRLADRSLAFNLSHSDDLMLLAVTMDDEVGVDLDRLDRLDGDWEGVARAALSPSERADLALCDGADRSGATMRVWIRKEAYTKALGGGFTDRFPSITVGLESRPALASVEDPAPGREVWRVCDLPVPAPWAAAIACRGDAARITNWQYS